LLLERPGELVSRKEIADRLWPGVYVTFDRSLNTAVNALRRALSDSPRNPRFLETRQGLGYRFIAPVEKVEAQSEQPSLDLSMDSIAVLPFQNDDPTLNSLADDIADRIVGTLSTAERLRVVARSATLRYRDRDMDAAAFGRDLNVRAVLAGRVVRHGDSFSISVELVETRTGWRLWGEQFDRSAAGVIAIEKDIVQGIARKLRLHWNGKPASKPDTVGREAYRDYLKGRYFYNKLTEDGLRKSVAYFDSALSADPKSALAHAGLADAYCLFAFLEIMPSSEALARARQEALAALAIDNDLAEAHAAMANVKKLRDWDWAGAESEYLKISRRCIIRTRLISPPWAGPKRPCARSVWRRNSIRFRSLSVMKSPGTCIWPAITRLLWNRPGGRSPWSPASRPRNIRWASQICS
jgi:TolB-like protein